MDQNVQDEELTIIDVYLGKENYSYDEDEEQNDEPYVIADIYFNNSPFLAEPSDIYLNNSQFLTDPSEATNIYLDGSQFLAEPTDIYFNGSQFLTYPNETANIYVNGSQFLADPSEPANLYVNNSQFIAQTNEPTSIYLNGSQYLAHPIEPANVYITSSPILAQRVWTDKSTQITDNSLLYQQLTGGTTERYKGKIPKPPPRPIPEEPPRNGPTRKSNYDITYKCIVCSKIFTNFTTYQVHLNEHSHLHSFTCAKCPQRFCNNPDLQEHMRVVHKVYTSRRKRSNF